MDAGGLLHLGDLGLAAGARNIGLVSPFNSLTEYYSGASLAVGSKQFSFHLGTDVTSSDGGVILHHGLELGYQQTVFIRVGYQWYAQPLSNQDEGGLSGGAGINLGDFKMDYSIADYGDLGLTNRVSLGYQFSLPKSNDADFDDERVSTVKGKPRGNNSQSTNQTGPSTVKTLPPTPTKLQFSPVSSDMTAWEPNLSVKGAYKIGIAAYKAQNYERAVKYLKKAISLRSSQSDSDYVAEANSMLGVIYQYDVETPNSDALAHHYYEAALKIDPNNIAALTHLPQLDPEHYKPPSR
jgi:tetratricopeptide (TPR) repeat protein